MWSGHSAGARHPRLLLERLETRELLSGYQPTAVEQLFLEELNDARANPAAYGASIGLDLSTVAPSQPLAFNPQLIQAARLHSQDMNARGYFSHVTPEGLDPGARISQAGFFWNGWGESIAGGSVFPNPSDALSALIIDNGIPDLGHRRQLLAIDAAFQTQNQVGVGILQNGTGVLNVTKNGSGLESFSGLVRFVQGRQRKPRLCNHRCRLHASPLRGSHRSRTGQARPHRHVCRVAPGPAARG